MIMFSRFHRIPARDGQTNVGTDGRTSCDGIVCTMHGIAW